ncbi:hypothetical protein ABZS66_42845 [Dactylosporangium sp. NPDC005572]|uniref:hypothetical protein n=1 Tax=Dactylosporangium sp. NPDC005572 TaxID=3156889 RepID=UPI00339E38C9
MRAKDVTRIALVVAATAALLIGADSAGAGTGTAPTGSTSAPAAQPSAGPTGPITGNNPWD